jgi:hypothetical protein
MFSVDLLIGGFYFSFHPHPLPTPAGPCKGVGSEYDVCHRGVGHRMLSADGEEFVRGCHDEEIRLLGCGHLTRNLGNF